MLAGQKVKRRLKRDALPSLFSFGPQPKQTRLASEKRAKQRHDQELRQEVSFKYTFYGCMAQLELTVGKCFNKIQWMVISWFISLDYFSLRPLEKYNAASPKNIF